MAEKDRDSARGTRRMTAKGLRGLIPSFSAESRVIFRADPLPGDRVNPPAEHPPSGVQIAGNGMAAQKHHTTTGDRARGLGANRTEARPVIKIVNREVFAVDYRVTAPDLQSERTSRNRRGVRESKLQTFTEVPAIGDRGKVLAPAHTVELTTSPVAS